MPKKLTIKKSALVPTVLISGGAGFIGSHLAEALLDNKARVIVLDNFYTGKEIHVNHLLKNPNFALFNVDINEGLPQEIDSVDYIFHLAGLEEYLYSKDYLNLNSLLTNSMGTKNLLDLAKKSDAKFLLASTIDVYQGRMSQLDLDEYFGKNNIDENKYSLTEAKRFAEAIVWEYYKKYDTDVKIVRLPEVYGPRMNLDSSGSLGSFLKEIIEGSDITIYGDGIEKEYYIYVKDAVSGLLKAMFNNGTKGNIYSLVDQKPYSVLETAYLVKKLADGIVEVKYDQNLKKFYDCSHIPDSFNNRDLGWKSKYSMKEGIEKTLEYFGYKANPNSFKPAKYVKQKNAKELFSLQELSVDSRFPEIKPEQSKNEEPTPKVHKFIKPEKEGNLISKPVFQPTGEPRGPRFKKEVKADNIGFEQGAEINKINIKEKKLKFPKISLRVPKISFPKLRSPSAGSKYPGFFGIFSGVLISGFLVFLFIPFVSSFFFLAKGGYHLNNVRSNFETLNKYKFEDEAILASKSFERGSEKFSKLYWVYNLFGKKDVFISQSSLISSLNNFSGGVKNLSASLEPINSIISVIRPDSNDTLDLNSFSEAVLGISNAKQQVKLAQADLLHVKTNHTPKFLNKELETYSGTLRFLESNLDLAWSLMSDLPSILGVEGQKKYIIWFQNSNEIRPTGGFIGSYSIVTLDNGKIVELKIDDIYNPDGQIDVRNIEYPQIPIISEYMQEDRAYLRNINWNPDFAVSVKDFDDLYYTITGDRVDGYIAVDLDFVRSLLEKIGPIYLASYDEEINADNLYERTQFHSSYNYEEGSESKRSFLTTLGSKLLENFFALEQKNYINVLGSVVNSLDGKHMLIYFKNSSFNLGLKEKGWDGGLVETEEDYLYVVNSNVGGTKANYFVKNQMIYEVDSLTRDGLLRATLTLHYTHTGKDNAWPGGPYKNYVRVLSQNGSKLTGAEFVDAGGTRTDVFQEIVVTEVGKYNSFEYGFTLNPEESIDLVLMYDLPQNLSLSPENMDYNILWQKQPGTRDDDYSFIFKPPFGVKVDSLSDSLIFGDISVGNSGKINENLKYFINFR